ncbi:MAG: hypothetical protein KME17_21110 [Cyanosarcina radialis HA8281-LM2]|jgi:Uma2 family endonuclease|nr:hypothetical protein [Cyanosarcina radialis HA8281-LM2]
MVVQIQIRQLDVPPGQRVLLHQINWHEFEFILEELGEDRPSRIAYSKGTLETRMPLPEREVNKEIVGDMVKILLEELEIDRECFGSTTFKREDMEHGRSVEYLIKLYILKNTKPKKPEIVNIT